MPAYHSKLNDSEFTEACGCALLPLKTEVKGPAPPLASDEEDIIDETLHYFRANVLFRNFEIKGSADRTMIYLTLFTCLLLVRAEKIDDKPAAVREFKNIATKQFPIPGDDSWPLGGLFPIPQSKAEADSFRAYIKQARDEISMRVTELLFDKDGTKNKWWQAFSKRKFMGKELKE